MNFTQYLSEADDKNAVTMKSLPTIYKGTNYSFINYEDPKTKKKMVKVILKQGETEKVITTYLKDDKGNLSKTATKQEVQQQAKDQEAEAKKKQ